MVRTIGLLLIGFILTIGLSNCSVFKKAKINSESSFGKEDFDQFYNRFHEDMDFQLSRVKFPLDGMMVDGDHETSWTPENFPLMKVRIYDIDEGSYNVSYKLNGDTFIQKVALKNSGFYAEYHFKQIKRKWYLVYAMDQNL